jgi:metal-responsive CopG/Arc/MetJ family transcriptional regulator
MSTHKVTISIECELLEEVDRLVADKQFGSRSQAIQVAVLEKLARLRRDRLAKECANLDHAVERSMAEEGISEELSAWPEY